MEQIIWEMNGKNPQQTRTENGTQTSLGKIRKRKIKMDNKKTTLNKLLTLLKTAEDNYKLKYADANSIFLTIKSHGDHSGNICLEVYVIGGDDRQSLQKRMFFDFCNEDEAFYWLDGQERLFDGED